MTKTMYHPSFFILKIHKTKKPIQDRVHQVKKKKRSEKSIPAVPFGGARSKSSKSWESKEVGAIKQVHVEYCNKAPWVSCKIDTWMLL